MGIIVSWFDPNSEPLDKVEILRAESKITAPVKIGEVGKNIYEYHDDTAVRNKTYWYTTIGHRGASAATSKPFPIGNYPDTGPGPDKIQRGDWTFGFFGEVNVGLLPSFDDIKNPSGIDYTKSPSKFYKCVVNGRILFIPDVPYSLSSGAQNTTIPKLCLPVDGAADSGIVSDKDGYSYAIRPPFHTTVVTTAFSGITTDKADATLKESESAMLVSCVQGSDKNKVFGDYQLGDMALPGYTGWFLTNTYMNAATFVMLIQFESAAASGVTVSNTASRGYWPVYELLLN